MGSNTTTTHRNNSVAPGETTPKATTSTRSDATDLILLAQSVYAHARNLPLGIAIAEGTINKSDMSFCFTLADGTQLLPPLPTQQHLNPGLASSDPSSATDHLSPVPQSASFDSHARLAVHKFRAAQCFGGTLHLSVVYDDSLSGQLWTPRPTPYTELSVKTSTDTTSDQPPMSSSRRASRRSAAGSPFPSPTIHRRALAVSNLQLGPTAIPQTPAEFDVGDGPDFVAVELRSISTTPLLITASSGSATPLSTASDLQMRIAAAAAAAASAPAMRSSLSRVIVRSSSNSSLSNESDSNDADAHEDTSDQGASNLQQTTNPHKSTGASHPPAPSTANLNSNTQPALVAPIARRFSASVTRMQANVAATMPPTTTTTTANSTKTTTSAARRIARSFEQQHRPPPLAPISQHPTPSSSMGGTVELFGSLVGSYEESILSGRMSTLPSRPIPFLAEIGVISMTKCRMSLKCPPHLLLAFPAYFYELQDDETPATPYVGSIDVDRRLGVHETPDGRVEYITSPSSSTAPSTGTTNASSEFSSPSPSTSKTAAATTSPSLQSTTLLFSTSKTASPTTATSAVPSGASFNDPATNHDADDVGERPHNHHRHNVQSDHGNHVDQVGSNENGNEQDADGDGFQEACATDSPSTAATPSKPKTKSRHDHEGYRLPPKGQLQLVIKNPSRTAIKVFLVQYDLREMPPNTKTFLRQKSYAIPPPPSPHKQSISATTASNSTATFSTGGSKNRSLPTHSHAASAPPTSSSTPTSKSSLSSTNTSPKSPSQLSYERLRYAIHLQFVCTARRHIYLAKSIRVVFSHRAPDTDERLRVVCEGPTNPKYIPIHAVTPMSARTSLIQRSPRASSDLTAFNMSFPARGQESATPMSPSFSSAATPATAGGIVDGFSSIDRRPMRDAIIADGPISPSGPQFPSSGRSPLSTRPTSDIRLPTARHHPSYDTKESVEVFSGTGNGGDRDVSRHQSTPSATEPRSQMSRLEAMQHQKRQAQMRLQLALARSSQTGDAQPNRDQTQQPQQQQQQQQKSISSSIANVPKSNDASSCSQTTWHPTDLAPTSKPTMHRTRTLSGFKQAQDATNVVETNDGGSSTGNFDNNSGSVIGALLSNAAAGSSGNNDIIARLPSVTTDCNGSPTLLGLKHATTVVTGVTIAAVTPSSLSSEMVGLGLVDRDRRVSELISTTVSDMHHTSSTQSPLALPPARVSPPSSPKQRQQHTRHHLFRHDHVSPTPASSVHIPPLSTSTTSSCSSCSQHPTHIDSYECASSFVSSGSRSLCSNGEKRHTYDDLGRHRNRDGDHQGSDVMSEPCTMR